MAKSKRSKPKTYGELIDDIVRPTGLGAGVDSKELVYVDAASRPNLPRSSKQARLNADPLFLAEAEERFAHDPIFDHCSTCELEEIKRDDPNSLARRAARLVQELVEGITNCEFVSSMNSCEPGTFEARLAMSARTWNEVCDVGRELGLGQFNRIPTRRARGVDHGVPIVPRRSIKDPGW